MKLRTRLFLWVGSTFFCFFIIAYIVEAFLVRSSIGKSEQALKSEIVEGYHQRNSHFEEFLGIVIADLQGQVDALLYRLEEYSFLKNKFLPKGNQTRYSTWVAASELLVVNKWIDFVQNTIDGKVSSLIVPDPIDLRKVERIWVNEDLSWIRRAGSNQNKWYLGLSISSNVLRMIADHSVNLEFQEQPSLFYFFDWQSMLDQQPLEELEASNQAEKNPVTIFDQVFRQKYNKALAYLQEHQKELTSRQDSEIKEWLISQKYRKRKKSKQRLLKPELYQGKQDIARNVIQEAFNESFRYHLNRDHVDMMIWGMSPLWRTKVLGESPLSKRAPVGIAAIQSDYHNGQALFSKEVFFEKRIFLDREYADKAHNKKKNLLTPSIALIFNPLNKILYFGNTLQLKGKGSKGLLTIGVNIDHMLQQLSVTTNQKAVLAYQGRVVSAYDENGNKADISDVHLPIRNMEQHKSGVFRENQHKYYFANLQPFHEIDLHFYIYEPVSEAFAFTDFLKKSTKEAIHTISLNMRIIAVIALLIGLVLLHYVARSVVKPIAQLAKATSSVGAGDFDKVELPEIPEKRHDEIVSLVHSFSQMLQGLKDREKVRGVLNKFVSKEIAEEILKGEVHLGGEEKVISILFADIRSFTKMTENMSPQEVVEMLNQCMTKITNVVDLAGGVIDKYVGDEAMALFGAPIAYPDHGLRAIYTGIKIVEEMQKWNEDRVQKNLPKVELGVGIHTGNVLVGNMGAENRLNYTVLGANVNLSARLCSFAGSSEVLITEETLKSEGVQAAVEVQKLEEHQFKGFSHETSLYRITKFKDPNFQLNQISDKKE